MKQEARDFSHVRFTIICDDIVTVGIGGLDAWLRRFLWIFMGPLYMRIGDSISSDVKGASALGIRTLWLNRFDKVVPDGVEAITNLLEAFDKI